MRLLHGQPARGVLVQGPWLLPLLHRQAHVRNGRQHDRARSRSSSGPRPTFGFIPIFTCSFSTAFTGKKGRRSCGARRDTCRRGRWARCSNTRSGGWRGISADGAYWRPGATRRTGATTTRRGASRRPPVAQERVELRQDGLVRIVLKRPFADGTLAVEMDPLSLLARLAALRGAATVPHGPLRRRPRAGESLAKAHRPRAAARPRAGARGGGRSTEACRDVPAVGRASEAHVWVRRARLQNVRGAHEAPRGCHRSGERGAVPRDDRRAQRHPRALAEPGSALLEEHRPAPKGPGRRRVT